MASTWWAVKTIYMTNPTSSGMAQVFTTGCAQSMRSGSRQDFLSGSSMNVETGAVQKVESGGGMTFESGSIVKNQNVTKYSSAATLAAVSGTVVLYSSKAAHFKLPAAVKGLDITVIIDSTFKTFLQSTIASVRIGSTRAAALYNVITFTTQAATLARKYGRNCRLVAHSTKQWMLVNPSTLQQTLSSST